METASASASVSAPRPLWINRNFALLWLGQAISYLGDFVFDTTLILWIAARIAAGQSWAPLAVSGVLVAVSVPTLLGGPIAGVFVDRWDKRHTMLVMDALRAVLIGLLLLTSGFIHLPFFAGGTLPVAGQLGVIYGIVFLATICQQFFGPSRVAIIGDIVPPEQRERASGLGQVTMSLAMIIGPPLAAPLLFDVGVQWALLVNALSFVVSFCAILLVQAPTAARSVRPGEAGDVVREFVNGLRFYGTSRVLRTILIAGTLIMLAVGGLNSLDIFFVIGNLHTPASLYGWLTMAFGVGAVSGAVAATLFARRIDPVRVFWLSLLAAGVLLFAYSRLTSFAPAIVVLGLVGIPTTALNVVITPLLLRETPRDLIGRVAAVINPVMSLASILSIVISGLLVSTWLKNFHTTAFGVHFGPVDTIFSAMGIMVTATGLYAMLALRGIVPSTSDTNAPAVAGGAPAPTSQ